MTCSDELLKQIKIMESIQSINVDIDVKFDTNAINADLAKDIGRRLVEVRKHPLIGRPITQQSLSSISGIDRVTISRIEGGYIPSMIHLPKLCKVLRVNIRYIILGNPNPMYSDRYADLRVKQNKLLYSWSYFVESLSDKVSDQEFERVIEIADQLRCYIDSLKEEKEQ